MKSEPFLVDLKFKSEHLKRGMNPLNNRLAELRFWCNGNLVDVQRIKNDDLNPDFDSKIIYN